MGCVPAAQAQDPLGEHGRHPCVGLRRIEEIRLLARQAEHDRLDGAVPVPGGPQRAEHLGPHTRHVRQQPLGPQRGHEGVRGPHRTHGVRARRANADREQVQRTEGHRLIRVICGSTSGSGVTVAAMRRSKYPISTAVPGVAEAGSQA